MKQANKRIHANSELNAALFAIGDPGRSENMTKKTYILLALSACIAIYFITKKRPQDIITDIEIPPPPSGANTEAVFIASCANPWKNKKDIELMDQHNDLLNFLLKRGISWGNLRLASSGISVPMYQFDKAKLLILDEIEKNPNRWDRLDFRKNIIGQNQKTD